MLVVERKGFVGERDRFDPDAHFVVGHERRALDGGEGDAILAERCGDLLEDLLNADPVADHGAGKLRHELRVPARLLGLALAAHSAVDDLGDEDRDEHEHDEQEDVLRFRDGQRVRGRGEKPVEQ